MFALRRFTMKRFKGRFQYNLLGGNSASEFSESLAYITAPTEIPAGQFRIHRVLPDPNAFQNERYAKRYQVWLGMENNIPTQIASSHIVTGSTDSNSSVRYADTDFQGNFIGTPSTNGTSAAGAPSGAILTTLNNTWYAIGGSLPYA